MTTYTAPPDQNGLVLHARDILEVNDGGTANDTTINSGGVENVNDGGKTNDTTINSGGVELVFAGGTAIGTTINDGGEVVFAGGTAIGTIIKNGGFEDVYNGGTAHNIEFSGPNATLYLATPSGLAGTVKGWQVGDVIDFVHTDVTSVHLTGSTLTVTYETQTASYTLAGQQANTEFKLQSDGNGGMCLTLVPAIGAEPPIVGVQHHEAAIHFGPGPHF